MKIFTCLNCGKKYKSRKENSKHCSKQCQKEYNRVSYNCDYCNMPMMITRGQAEKLKSGEKKGKFCSKKCHNLSQITSEINICMNCGKEYKVFKCVVDLQKFCCKKCFEEYREKNARKKIPRECAYCHCIFYSERENPIFCSSECSSKSQRKREICNCDYCGKPVEKINWEINKSNLHFCNKICKILYQQWSKHDCDILKEYYRKIPTKDIIPLLSKPYTSQAIKSEAGRLGLWQNRLWTKEEEDIIKNFYATLPMSEVLNLLPNRTFPSILHKAQEFQIKSYFFNTRIYTEDQKNFLRNNYLIMSNEELAKKLNRNSKNIQQKLWAMGLIRPFDPKTVCYKNIVTFIRARIEVWRNHYREECNYICSVSGKQSNIVVHHCRSFNLLLEETIEELDFEIKDNFIDYTKIELERFLEKFLEIQEYYGEYCCVDKNIHKLFHDNYGYGDNTIEQWNEFVEKYKNNYYNY